MANTDDTSLSQRILEYYHRKGWYGPLLEVSETQSDPDELWIGDDRLTSPFPVATEEQLRLTEEAMGFPYPPLLRSLYLHVGNGGFGPGQGLVGAFPTDSEIGDNIDDKEEILAQRLCPFPLEDRTLIDVEQYEAQHGQVKNMYTSDIWPKDLIYLCDWGEGASFLHARTERVYYLMGDYLSHEADSLEEWLERWLQSESLNENPTSYIIESYIIKSYIVE